MKEVSPLKLPTTLALDPENNCLLLHTDNPLPIDIAAPPIMQDDRDPDVDPTKEFTKHVEEDLRGYIVAPECRREIVDCVFNNPPRETGMHLVLNEDSDGKKLYFWVIIDCKDVA